MPRCSARGQPRQRGARSGRGHGAHLRAQLSAQGLRLPTLGGDDETANRAYIKHLVLHRDAELGRQPGLDYAEAFHYIGPEPPFIDEYVKRNAVRL